MTEQEIDIITKKIANSIVDILREKDLIIAPRIMVESAIEENRIKNLRNRYLNKKALTFKEISDSEIWGPIGTRAVKAYAEKHAKENEIFAISSGVYAKKKIIISAVERIAKHRGNF